MRFDQSNIVAVPGQIIQFNVFFDETITSPSIHRLDLAGGTNGLLSANFQMTVSGPASSQITLANGNPLFDLGPTVVIANPTSVTQAALLNPPLFGTPNGLGTRSSLVGSLTIVANGNVGEQNVVSLGDLSLASDDFVIDDGFGGLGSVADSSISFQNFTITMTAIPEPSSLGMLTLLTMCQLIRRNRRRIL